MKKFEQINLTNTKNLINRKPANSESATLTNKQKQILNIHTSEKKNIENSNLLSFDAISPKDNIDIFEYKTKKMLQKDLFKSLYNKNCGEFFSLLKNNKESNDNHSTKISTKNAEENSKINLKSKEKNISENFFSKSHINKIIVIKKNKNIIFSKDKLSSIKNNTISNFNFAIKKIDKLEKNESEMKITNFTIRNELEKKNFNNSYSNKFFIESNENNYEHFIYNVLKTDENPTEVFYNNRSNRFNNIMENTESNKSKERTYTGYYNMKKNSIFNSKLSKKFDNNQENKLQIKENACNRISKSKDLQLNHEEMNQYNQIKSTESQLENKYRETSSNFIGNSVKKLKNDIKKINDSEKDFKINKEEETINKKIICNTGFLTELSSDNEDFRRKLIRNNTFDFLISSKKPLNNKENLTENHTKSDAKNRLIERVLKNKRSDFYCPHCSHCNNLKDENLTKYFELIEGKNIIRKGFEYIINFVDLDNKNYMDVFLQKNVEESPILLTDVDVNNAMDLKESFKSEKLRTKSNKNDEIHTKIKNEIINTESKNQILIRDHIKTEKKQFTIEDLFKSYKRNPILNNKHIFEVVTHFLNSLLDDKISIEKIVGNDTMEKMKDNLISQGLAFEEKGGIVDFDKELGKMFDEKTKEKIKKLFKKKYFNLKQIEHEKNFDRSEENKLETSKKFTVLFLILIEILSDIGTQFKGRAFLLYKVFKMYFIEQEKKWIFIVSHIKERITYYKELCKAVIQQNNKHLNKIEDINDVLFAKKISEENLQAHKKLIHDLLNVINEKRDQIYLLKSEKEILEKELSFWVYDFERIKIHPYLREKMKHINVDNLVKNVYEEFSHKSITDAEKSLIVNTDRFLLASGQRNYFYDQKDYYINEIDKVRALYEKNRFKKKRYKKRCEEIQNNLQVEIERLEKDIKYFREKLSCEKKDVLIGTDLDYESFNKLLKNNSVLKNLKSQSINKLLTFTEKIRFGCSKQKPLDKITILGFLPELYNEKIALDNQHDYQNQYHLSMDEFLLKFMRQRFTITKISKKNIEQTLISIIKYSDEDKRIKYAKRFLGIYEKRLRTEILDSYILLLKNLPISFFKIFDEIENSKTLIVSLETCIEIYLNKFNNYMLHMQNFDDVIKCSQILINDREKDIATTQLKKDLYFLSKFYNESTNYIQTLLMEFKSNIKMYESSLVIAEKFIITNKDYNFSLMSVLDILKRNFIFFGDEISLESFFDYFVEKYYFKIRIIDFVDITLESLIEIYDHLEKKLIKMWNKLTLKNRDIMHFKDFENVLMSLMENDTENMWKFNEYFKYACQTEEKDYLTKEELITFCLNHKDFLPIILEERKSLFKNFQ